jgi:site-specific recombinase XerD
MKPKTYLFPGTVNNWRADVPITEKIVWTAVAKAAKHAGITKHVAPHTLRHYAEFRTMPNVSAMTAA